MSSTPSRVEFAELWTAERRYYLVTVDGEYLGYVWRKGRRWFCREGAWEDPPTRPKSGPHDTRVAAVGTLRCTVD